MSAANTTWELLEPGVDRPAGQRHTFVVERKTVDVIEIDDLSFHPSSAVLLLEAAPPPPGTRRDKPAFGLAAVAAALAHAKSAGGYLLIASHESGAGGEAVDRLISRHRADNVLALLKGDRAAWITACERHEVRDLQAILAAIALREGVDCDPGPVDGKWGPRSRAALRGLRASVRPDADDAELNGPLAKQDWATFFAMYERALARALDTDVTALPGMRGALRFLTPETLACGAHWPVMAKHREHVRSTSARRTELLFFPDPAVPPFAAEKPPGRSLYQNELRFRRKYVELEAPKQHLRVKVMLDGEPLRNEDYELLVDGGEPRQGNTGAAALVEHDIPRSARGASLRLRGRDLAFSLRFAEGLQDAAELRGVQRRLQNLSYYAGPLHGELDADTVAGLRAFQRDRGLDVTGQDDAATRAELRRVFGS